jgi:hypothetical protein
MFGRLHHPVMYAHLHTGFTFVFFCYLFYPLTSAHEGSTIGILMAILVQPLLNVLLPMPQPPAQWLAGSRR